MRKLCSPINPQDLEKRKDDLEAVMQWVARRLQARPLNSLQTIILFLFIYFIIIIIIFIFICIFISFFAYELYG